MADKVTTFQFEGKENLSTLLQGIIEKMVLTERQARDLAQAFSQIGEAQKNMQKSNLTSSTVAGSVNDENGVPRAFSATTIGTVSQNSKLMNSALVSMAGASGQAQKALGGVDSELQKKPKDLNNATDALGKFTKFVEDGVAKMKNFAFGIVEYMALQAFMDMLQKAQQQFENIVATADKFFVMQRSFVNLFGEANGAGMFQRTAMAAAQMSVPIQDLAENQERLLTAGMKQKDVIPLLTSLTAVVRGTGGSVEQLNGALNAFAQIQEKGKLQSEELVKQLGNRNIPAVQLAAREMGISAAELRDKVQAGTVTVNEFFDAFRKGATKDFGSMLEPSKRSLADINVMLDDSRQLLDAAWGTSAMESRKAAAIDLYHVLTSPLALRAAEINGSIFGNSGGAGTFIETANKSQDVMRAYIIQQLTNLNQMGSLLHDGKFTNPLQSPQEFVQQQTQIWADAMVKAATEATSKFEDMGDGAADTAAQVKKITEELSHMNDQLREQKSIRDALDNLDKAKADYQQTAALAVDVLSSAGQNANLSLNDKGFAVTSAQRNLNYVLATNTNNDRMYDMAHGDYSSIPGYNAAKSKRATISGLARYGVTPQDGVAGFCTNCGTSFVANTVATNSEILRNISTNLGYGMASR